MGELTQHPKYGQQLKLSRYQKSNLVHLVWLIISLATILRGLVKTAEKIIALYGHNTIDHILEDPSKLETISGLSKANRQAFVAKLKLNYGTEQLIAGLVELGLSNRFALQAFEKYKEEALDLVKENPYQLVEDLQGFGFKWQMLSLKT